MTDFTLLGKKIKATIEADAWLGDVANVKKVEVHKRGFSIQKQKGSEFFTKAELPAISVDPNAAGKQSDQNTVQEIDESVTASVGLITHARDFQSGMDAHYDIVKRIETLFDAQKTSAKDLNGMDAFVESVSTPPPEDTKSGDDYFFMSETTLKILLTATF